MTCLHVRSTIYDTRAHDDINARREVFPYRKLRRHRCLECGCRFATYEMTEDQVAALAWDRLGYLRHKLVEQIDRLLMDHKIDTRAMGLSAEGKTDVEG